MNANYKIIGEDGKEYGPATAEQIQQWIVEARIEHRTPIFVAGAKDWNFVGLLPEFANFFVASSTSQTISPSPAGVAPAGQTARTNSYAQGGLVFGILSVICCCCGFPFAILGLIFSLIALSQINANPQLHGGHGLAIAGLILSILSLLMGASSLFFNLLAAQPHVSWSAGGF